MTTTAEKLKEFREDRARNKRAKTKQEPPTTFQYKVSCSCSGCGKDLSYHCTFLKGEPTSSQNNMKAAAYHLCVESGGVMHAGKAYCAKCIKVVGAKSPAFTQLEDAT